MDSKEKRLNETLIKTLAISFLTMTLFTGSQTLQSIILLCNGTNKDGRYLTPKWLFLCMYIGLTIIWAFLNTFALEVIAFIDIISIWSQDDVLKEVKQKIDVGSVKPEEHLPYLQHIATLCSEKEWIMQLYAEVDQLKKQHRKRFNVLSINAVNEDTT
ncbi:uncharacterized protein LOC122314275 isoform X2 [Carya illinoinensis]|uniref:uncharacterized protein LOC122314275 isoform X2 n=1 Tax=Carya illinoinensis TaxID=32201 RepID=UPI001C7265AC|nr:uncharacterized protein LOC122314275 isoform X2 [Carya illinoinensis]